MSDILCVTNRMLCREDLLTRIEKIAAAHPAGILLREKDLTADQYRALAEKVLRVCRLYGTPCILHNFADIAAELHCPALHLPLPLLRKLPQTEKVHFSVIGTSCHSVKDAEEAARLGCTYLIAGHIFETDCKKGLPGRGISFLSEVCNAAPVPVYAIGGICSGNIAQVRKAGAAGACVMSGIMTTDNIPQYLSDLEEVPHEI